MYSITSIFNHENQALWTDLEKSCKHSGFSNVDIPHFSWQSAESYQFEPLKQELFRLSQTIAPFSFQTSGLGIFANKRKIFFLIIVKNRALLELHQLIWERTLQFAIASNLHYSPENWIPHITLNLNELSEEQFKWSVDELISRPLNFEFRVNQFGLIFLNPATSGADSVYPLLGKVE